MTTLAEEFIIDMSLIKNLTDGDRLVIKKKKTPRLRVDTECVKKPRVNYKKLYTQVRCKITEKCAEIMPKLNLHPEIEEAVRQIVDMCADETDAAKAAVSADEADAAKATVCDADAEIDNV